jgi:hypothetical protein
MLFGFVNVTLLHSDHRHVSAMCQWSPCNKIIFKKPKEYLLVFLINCVHLVNTWNTEHIKLFITISARSRHLSLSWAKFILIHAVLFCFFKNILLVFFHVGLGPSGFLFKPCIYLFYIPYMPHVPPIPYSLICWPKYCLVTSTNHEVPQYAVSHHPTYIAEHPSTIISNTLRK